MRLDGFRRTGFLRGVLATVVAIDVATFFMFLGDARARALGEGVALPAFADLLSRPLVSGPLIMLGVAAAVVFGWRAGRLWAGLIPLAVLALLSTAHAQLFGSPWRHLYYSGVCLSGWLLGLALSRWRGMPVDESYARIGATALLGAVYLNGGISKLVFGGWDWALGVPIQAIVVAQDGMVADSALSAYRGWVVATPLLAGLFSGVTILVELAGPLMIVGGGIRAAVALGLLAMHVNILVLTHILYWEAMVFLVAFGLLPSAEPLARSAAAVRSRSILFPAGAAALVLLALFGISRQSRRFAEWYVVGAAAPPPLAAAPDALPAKPAAGGSGAAQGDESAHPSQASLLQVGPFTVGQTLVAGWTVAALEITDGGFVAVLSGEPGRARFEVTCAPSPYRSPFDLGAAHIFYSKHVAFEDLEAAGMAFRERVREAGNEDAICDRVSAWRLAAQAGALAQEGQ
jgi:hypothetical protein